MTISLENDKQIFNNKTDDEISEWILFLIINKDNKSK